MLLKEALTSSSQGSQFPTILEGKILSKLKQEWWDDLAA